jgi:hypothetical protein
VGETAEDSEEDDGEKKPLTGSVNALRASGQLVNCPTLVQPFAQFLAHFDSWGSGPCLLEPLRLFASSCAARRLSLPLQQLCRSFLSNGSREREAGRAPRFVRSRWKESS